MAKTEAPTGSVAHQMANEQRARESAPAAPPKTHLLARSRSQREFARGGIRFSTSLTCYPLADISPEKLDAILKEPMIESHLIDETEARRHMQAGGLEFDETISRSELIEVIKRQERKIHSLTERLAKVEQDLQGDRPPRKSEQLPPANPANMPQQRG